MTTILKGYYLKVTLENRLVKHNGRKVYLSIVEHGNGIPDHALILKTSAKCMKFSVCLSIRSQCGWKELDQNESGELTFDLKVEVNGKSQRAPLFPLIFQLCEKHFDQVVIISKSVIPVKAITKIPKKSLRAELVPLGELELKPPSSYLASPSDSATPIVEDEEMVDGDEDKDEDMNSNPNEDEDDEDQSITQKSNGNGSLRSSSSSVSANKKSKTQKDEIDSNVTISMPNNNANEVVPNLRNSSPNMSTLANLINQDNKTHSLENLLNNNSNANNNFNLANSKSFMSGLLLSTTNNNINSNLVPSPAKATTASTSTTNKKKRQLSISAPNVPQTLNNNIHNNINNNINNNNSSTNSNSNIYSISNITNNINNGFNNFKALSNNLNKPALTTPSINGADLDTLSYLSTLALQNNSNSTNNNNNNNNNNTIDNLSPTTSPPVVPNISMPSSPSLLGNGGILSTPTNNSSISSNSANFYMSPDTEKSPPMNGIKNIINNSSNNPPPISSISNSINNHFNNHKHLMSNSNNNINNLLSPTSTNINLSSLLLSQTPSSFPSITSNNSNIPLHPLSNSFPTNINSEPNQINK